MNRMTEPVLEIRNAVKYFSAPNGKVLKAVNNVSCQIAPQECLAVIGESGCGKSTLAKLVMRIEPMNSGEVFLEGRQVTGRKKTEQRQIWREMQMIFQNASDVISPRMKIGTFLMEPWKNFRIADKAEAKEKIWDMLKEVYLDESCLQKYPHQLSGGELQRVCIARAFSMKPKIMVCDEITSALDVSVQDGVMKLFRRIQKETGTACLFICHDLALVHDYSDRVMVMYLGHVVEMMKSSDLGIHAVHPYTRALLRSMFFIGEKGQKKKIVSLPGESISPFDLPEGCCFCTRCPRAAEICRKAVPVLKETEKGHWIACHRICAD